MPDDAVTILLLRHGQSEWNALHRWQGTADSPLNELGRRQARQSADSLRDLPRPVTGVWSSHLGRASETARIIAASHGIGSPGVDRRLEEAFAGEWEGMTPDEIELEWPGYLEAHRRPPSFEPTERVMDRAIAALGDIAREAGWFAGRGLTVVVSHSGFIRTVRRCLGAVDQRIPNLGGSWITVTPTGRSTDLTIGELFDPAGITISGVDAPGEDPALPSR